MGPLTSRRISTRLKPYNPQLSNVSPPKPEVDQIRVRRIPSPARTSVVLVHASSLTPSSPCCESEFSFLLLLNSGMAGVLSWYDGCEGLVLDMNRPQADTHLTRYESGKCLEKEPVSPSRQTQCRTGCRCLSFSRRRWRSTTGSWSIY